MLQLVTHWLAGHRHDEQSWRDNCSYFTMLGRGRRVLISNAYTLLLGLQLIRHALCYMEHTGNMRASRQVAAPLQHRLTANAAVCASSSSNRSLRASLQAHSAVQALRCIHIGAIACRHRSPTSEGLTGDGLGSSLLACRTSRLKTRRCADHRPCTTDERIAASAFLVVARCRSAYSSRRACIYEKDLLLERVSHR